MRDHPGPAVAPWNPTPATGALPLLVEDEDIDLDHHVRHSALPASGGQRELGVLISRLHSHQLDLRRPLWALQRLAVHMGEALDELGAYVAAAA